MEEEWNEMLDLCKQSAQLEPAPDTSLGSSLRQLMRQRRHKWVELQAELAQLAAPGAAGTRRDGAEPGAAWEPGLVRQSEHECEACSRCFDAIDKLDRHRLLCLKDLSSVVVRSHKAFSGFEGVVGSQVKGKWEAYIISDRGYGRKRLRVGEVFDTPEAAAKEYAVACREMLLTAAAERAVAAAQSSEEEDGSSQDVVGKLRPDTRDAGGSARPVDHQGSASRVAEAADGDHETGNSSAAIASETKSSSSEASPMAKGHRTAGGKAAWAGEAGGHASAPAGCADGDVQMDEAAQDGQVGEPLLPTGAAAAVARQAAPNSPAVDFAVAKQAIVDAPAAAASLRAGGLSTGAGSSVASDAVSGGGLPAPLADVAGTVPLPPQTTAAANDTLGRGAYGARVFSFDCSSCSKPISIRITAAQLAATLQPRCSCVHCGVVLQISPPPGCSSLATTPSAPPAREEPIASTAAPVAAPPPAVAPAAAAPASAERVFSCKCVGCSALLRFSMRVSAEACKARTSCPKCGKQLVINIPASNTSANSCAQGMPSASNASHPAVPAPAGPALPAWAVRARADAVEEEDVEDTDAVLSVPESLVHWHWANLEYANGSQLASLSNRWWDADDAYDFGGDHSLLPEGYGGLLRKVAVGLNIKLEHVVKKVTRTPSGASVHVATGRAGTERVLQADAVVISLPLGVLKANAVAFDPPLPLRKQHAIDRLGFGILNKVLLGFDVAFWKDREGRRDFWGIAAKTSRQRGQAFQFWNMTRCTGHPLLLVLHAGRSAVLPGSDAEAARAAVGATMDALRSIFGQGVVPEPTSQQVTRWEHDPFALGVYSHVAVGASARDYDVMAEPLWDGNLLWAGEATCREHPATVAGAFLSGVREAGRLACRMYKEAQAQAPTRTAASSAPRAAAAATEAGAPAISAPAVAPQVERPAPSLSPNASAPVPEPPLPLLAAAISAMPPAMPMPAAPAHSRPLPLVQPGLAGSVTAAAAAAITSVCSS